MSDDIQPQKPWYRHGMVWLVVGIPTWSVVAGIYFIIIANSGSNDVVVDNYYKDGLAINQSFAQDNQAKALQISAYLSVNDKQQLVAKVSNTKVPYVEFVLSHHSDRDFDIKGAMVLAQANDSGGVYRFDLSSELKGRWFVQLRAEENVGQTPWRLQAKLDFPLAADTLLEPIEH